MQYQVSPTNSVWSLIDGLPIKLWKCNLDGSPKLPTKVPSSIPYRPIWVNNALSFVEKEKFINVALSKYVEFWK